MLVRYAQEEELEAVGRLTVAAYGDQVSDRYAVAVGDAAARAREAQLLVCVDHTGRLMGTATFVDGPGRWHEIAATRRSRVQDARGRARMPAATAPARH